MDPNTFVPLFQIREQMAHVAQQQKELKVQYKPVEQAAIKWLIDNQKRYVDKTGSGPYIALKPCTTKGSWNEERYLGFFNYLIPALRAGVVQTPADCHEKALEFLKQFNESDIGIEETKKRPSKDMTEIIRILEQNRNRPE